MACPISDACCVLNPMASILACRTQGRQIDTDPCNILNPNASKVLCNDKSMTPASAKSGLIIGALGFVFLIIFIAIIGVVIYFYKDSVNYKSAIPSSVRLDGGRRFKSRK